MTAKCKHLAWQVTTERRTEDGWLKHRVCEDCGDRLDPITEPHRHFPAAKLTRPSAPAMPASAVTELPIPALGEIYVSRTEPGKQVTITRLWAANNGPSVAYDIWGPDHLGRNHLSHSACPLRVFHATYTRHQPAGTCGRALSTGQPCPDHQPNELATLRAAALADLRNIPAAADTRWRLVFGEDDDEASTSIGPVCTDPGHEPEDATAYDCCPEPIIDTTSPPLAAYLVALLNADQAAG